MSSNTIEASFDTLMSQASDTVGTYLRGAVTEIDKAFGNGYAEKHPELVAAFIQAAASDFNASATAKVIGASLNRIAEGLERMSESD